MRRKPWFLVLLVLTLLVNFLPVNSRAEGAFYQSLENADMDYYDASSRWSFARSMETEHYYIFWEEAFGDDPNGEKVPEALRVDVQDLAEKLETFYATETKTLGFDDIQAINGYKLQVYLLYTTDWVATGSGYDNQIGALWVSPSTCQPVGSVIAHEVGHCFQYLVYCRQLAEGQEDNNARGFRYSYQNGLGNAFWELSAQWQSWQDYPEEQFTDYEMETWFENYFRSFENEWTRYQNYWLITYFAETYGTDWLSTIWKASRADEDALACHLRVNLHGDLEQLYRELYDYAAHAVTFDFSFARPYTADWQGRYDAALCETGDGWQQITYANTPEAGGFSAVKLAIPEDGVLQIDFEGIQPGSTLAEDDPGLCITDASGNTETVHTYNAWDGTAGWRYGVAALLADGNRDYSPMYSDAKGNVTYTVPENTELLYFVVLGAPETYVPHVWDETEKTDVQMPYRFRIVQ